MPTPTAPAAPATPPATTATPVQPPKVNKGKMTFQLKKLAEPLELDQVVRDPAWDKFKTVMVFLGGIAIMAWLAYISFSIGGANTEPRISQPTAIATPAPSQAPADDASEREHRFKEYLRSQDR